MVVVAGVADSFVVDVFVVFGCEWCLAVWAVHCGWVQLFIMWGIVLGVIRSIYWGVWYVVF